MRNSRLLFTLISTSLLLTGCASFREYEKPDTPESVQAVQLEQTTEHVLVDTEPVIAWWGEFNDPELSQLVEQALNANPDIRMAYANLLEARALNQEIGYARQPSVDVNTNVSRNVNSQQTTSGDNVPRNNTYYEGGFDASWELDLFNRISAQIEAQQALTESAKADLENIYITIAAEIARNYIELRGSQYRLAIANRNISNQEETHKLTKVLFEAGRASGLDVSRAETQLTLTRATVPPLEAAVTASINRLATLTSQNPDALVTALSKTKPLPDLPISIAIGNTESLLKRRPDIRSAERNLAASVANYNVAVSDLFPTVSLIGSLGFITTNLTTFGTSALAGSLGPTLEWQAFNRDAIRARINQADARTLAQLANYDKTVLAALEETKTALNDFSKEEERRATLQQAARSANHSAGLAKQLFDQGYSDFLDVLDAERTLLETEDTLATSEISSITQLIAIYKSLGGGWQLINEDKLATVEKNQ